MVTPTVGILALQGGYAAHKSILDRLAVTARLVRTAHELAACDALILPGGESTTLTHLMQHGNLYDPLRSFAERCPLLGTCAGLILMGHSDDPAVRSLELIDVTVSRNGYGRQQQSFRADVMIEDCAAPVSALFIRAPRIVHLAATVAVHGCFNQEPVLVSQGRHFAMSFHPELTGETAVHRLWLERSFAAIADMQSAIPNDAARYSFG